MIIWCRGSSSAHQQLNYEKNSRSVPETSRYYWYNPRLCSFKLHSWIEDLTLRKCRMLDLKILKVEWGKLFPNTELRIGYSCSSEFDHELNFMWVEHLDVSKQADVNMQNIGLINLRHFINIFAGFPSTTKPPAGWTPEKQGFYSRNFGLLSL